MSPSPASSSPSLSARYFYLFKIWCCFLVFGIIPLDLIYRLDSLLLSMTALDIVVNTAALTLIMVILAALIALPGAPGSLLLSSLLAAVGKPGNRPAPGADVGLLTEPLLLFLTCWNFARFLKYFFLKINHEITIPSFSFFVAMALCALILYRTRSDFHQRAQRLVASLTRRHALPSACAIAVLITGVHAGLQAAKPHRKQGKQPPHASGTPQKARPNIILITFDALAAEDMSLYGYHLNTTPNIDSFAKQCYVFDNAIAAANWTKPSVASFLTGELPYHHRLINTSPWSGSSDVQPESLPAYLQQSGYRTSSLVVNWAYAHPYINGTFPFFDDKPFTGFDMAEIPLHQRPALYLTKLSLIIQSHLHISAPFWVGEIYNGLGSHLDRFFPVTKPTAPPKMIFDLAQKIPGKENRDQPFLLWLHPVPPHSPYLAGAPFKGMFLPGPQFEDNMSQIKFGFFYTPKDQGAIDLIRLRYNENIRYADDALGKYLEFLRKTGRLDDSVVLISADHGESFSHGFFSHGGLPLYQPVVRIPLLVHLPGQTSMKRVGATVSQTDIAPTLLDLVGHPVPSTMDGRSLRPEMEGTPVAPRPIFSMNLDGNSSDGKMTKGSIAVFEGDYKYIYYLSDGREELFHLKDDKQEKSNLAEHERDRSRRMYQLISDKVNLQRK